jgi:hypothetical protein
MRITEAELHEAVAAAAKGSEPADARTGVEICAATGMDVRKLRMSLHALQAAGRLVVHKVTRQALDGRMSKVAAYTILPPPKKKR